MQRHYEELAKLERDGFEIIVDKTYEDIDPWDQLSECFDSREQLLADIDSCKYDWFMLRVRAMVDGCELGSAYLGGMLYENPEEVLTDGMAEELIQEAVDQAKDGAARMLDKLRVLCA